MLPADEWLSEAKKLPIGGRRRVFHNEEPTAAMVVGNDPDKWWAYCHRCHEGGAVDKDLVVLGVPEVQPPIMPWPADAMPAASSRLYRSAYGLLLRKGIDIQTMLPELPLYISERTQRLALPTASGWIGRALAGQQPKWLAYGTAPVYAVHPHDKDRTGDWVLTEDYLSAIKVRRACPHVVACAVLGTRIHTRLMEKLLTANSVGLFFDGDKAGDEGAAYAYKRLVALGIPTRLHRPPDGKDPKDLPLQQLRNIIGGGSV